VWLARVDGADVPHRLGTFGGPEEELNAPRVTFADDGQQVVAANGFAGLVRRWNAASGSQRGPDVEFPAQAVHLAGDGETIALADADGVTLLRIPSGKIVSTLKVPLPFLLGLSGDGRLAAVLNARTLDVSVWNTVTKRRASTLQRNRTVPLSFYGAAFSSDGTAVALGTETGAVELFETATGLRRGAPFEGHARLIVGLVFAGNGSRVVSSGGDGLMVSWLASGEGPLERVLSSHSENWDIAVSPDSSVVAVGRSDGVIELVDALTAKPEGELAGRTGPGSAAFSPDGRTLAAVSESSGRLFLWNVATRRLMEDTEAGPSPSYSPIAFSPDATQIAAGSVDGNLTFWNASGRVLHTVSIGTPLYYVTFSQSGRLLAVGGDETIRLIDVERPDASPRILRGHTGGVNDVAFSPDGELLASVSVDGTLRYWNVSDGTPLGAPLSSQGVSLHWVDFSPNGDVLATKGEAGVTLWDVANRTALGEDLDLGEEIAGAPPDDLDVLPNGQAFISLAAPLVVRLESPLWSDEIDRLAERVCVLVGRSLTRSEWDLLIPGLAYGETCVKAPAT
jgi:WD40 repeat protein